MNVKQESFGKLTDGRAVELFTLTNAGGLVAKITNFGGILTSLQTPDRNGKIEEITLGYDSLAGYLGGVAYFGATIGRFGNRITDGLFTLDGQQFTLAKNDNNNHLHGGNVGFDKVIWKAQPFENSGESGLKLSYLSPDGEEGYPGNLSVDVTYTLTNADELRIDYSATTDKPTPLNLTNHAYFNLATAGVENIRGHLLTINADKYLPINETGNPSGEIANVADTPMDFRTPHTIGERIDDVPGGYDHCYVINHPADCSGDIKKPTLTAKVLEPSNGRVMEIFTTEPGVQFYSGNFLDGFTGRAGAAYQQHHGFCLETQHYPDSPNFPDFPSTILRPGQTYTQRTIHQFSTE